MIIIVDTEKLRREGYKTTEVKNIRTRCAATGKAAEELRYHLPAKVVEKMLRTSTMNLSNASKKNLFPSRQGGQTNRYYDVREIIGFLWESINGYDVDLRIKKQKEIKLTIENEKARGELIDAATAEERSVMFLNGVKRMFTYIVKTSAALLVGCNSPRIAEKILFEQYKDIFKMLEDRGQRIEWDNEKTANSKEI